MGAGSGGATGRGPATRQCVAAALVLASIPAGVTAGLLDDAGLATWLLAGSALGAALILLAGSPAGGRAAQFWRLLGLGAGLWGGAAAALASTYGDLAAAPVPSQADAPRLVGLLILAVAIVLMAVARTYRDDDIAHIDAAIVAIGFGVVLVAFLWPGLRDADLERGAVPVGIASGVLACLVVGAAVR